MIFPESLAGAQKKKFKLILCFVLLKTLLDNHAFVPCKFSLGPKLRFVPKSMFQLGDYQIGKIRTMPQNLWQCQHALLSQ